jgi:hypothetical protein
MDKHVAVFWNDTTYLLEANWNSDAASVWLNGERMDFRVGDVGADQHRAAILALEQVEMGHFDAQADSGEVTLGEAKLARDYALALEQILAQPHPRYGELAEAVDYLTDIPRHDQTQIHLSSETRAKTLRALLDIPDLELADAEQVRRVEDWGRQYCREKGAHVRDYGVSVEDYPNGNRYAVADREIWLGDTLIVSFPMGTYGHYQYLEGELHWEQDREILPEIVEYALGAIGMEAHRYTAPENIIAKPPQTCSHEEAQAVVADANGNPASLHPTEEDAAKALAQERFLWAMEHDLLREPMPDLCVCVRGMGNEWERAEQESIRI